MKITKDTNLAQLTAKHPQAARVLNDEYGLHCIGCFASSFDTLEAGAKIHGMSEEEVEKMMERLNKVISSS